MPAMLSTRHPDFEPSFTALLGQKREDSPDVDAVVAAIIADVLAGMHADSAHSIVTEPDRARAIALAIGEAGVGDVVLLAGKGHEDYQEIGGRRLAFSDLLAAQECLQAGKAAMPPQGAA